MSVTCVTLRVPRETPAALRAPASTTWARCFRQAAYWSATFTRSGDEAVAGDDGVGRLVEHEAADVVDLIVGLFVPLQIDLAEESSVALADLRERHAAIFVLHQHEEEVARLGRSLIALPREAHVVARRGSA